MASSIGSIQTSQFQEGFSLIGAGAGTSLHEEVSLGNVTRVQELLKGKVDVNAKDHSGCTPAHLAAERNYPDIVCLLRDAGADLTAKDFEGNNPLHLGAKRKSSESVKLLLEMAVDPDVENISGETPLHISASVGDGINITYLVMAGAGLNARDGFKKTPLHHAAEHGSEVSLKLLLEAGADASLLDQYGHTPLYCAIAKGDVKCLQTFIDAHIPLELHHPDKFTALYVAVTMDQPEILKCLINAGMNIDDLGNPDSGTPLFCASDNSERCLDILIDAGADVNWASPDFGTTALHCAALNSEAASVRKLILAGANIHAQNNDGQTPVDWALRGGNVENLTILLEAGAFPRFGEDGVGTPLHAFLRGMRRSDDRMIALIAVISSWLKDHTQGTNVFNLKDEHGDTVLHLAAELSLAKSCQALVEAGASLDQKNNSGERPYDILVNKGEYFSLFCSGPF